MIETTPELQTADTPEPAKLPSTRVLMSGTDTEGRFALIQMVVRREHEPPCHLHTREDEVVYVVEGTVVVSINGVGTDYTAGEAVFLPRGQAHGYLVRTDKARLLVLAMPAGIEGFYTDLEAAQLDARYVERMITLAARYGVEITGPPIRETSSPSDILPEGGVLPV